MKITITLQQLQDAGACDEAVELFKATYGESATEIWTRERQIEVLKSPLGRFVGWAYAERLIPLWSLQYADLRSADLQFANLRSANLRSADLRSANLRHANLRHANLRHANLQSADLQSANLQYADLRSANLQYADLRSADLRSADLRFADLRFADLQLALRRDNPPDGWEIENGILKRK